MVIVTQNFNYVLDPCQVISRQDKNINYVALFSTFHSKSFNAMYLQ